MSVLALYALGIPATITAGALFGHAMSNHKQGDQA